MKKRKSDNGREIRELIGRCVEVLCQRQAENFLDEEGDKRQDISDWLKMIQLLEKYQALMQSVEAEVSEDIVQIDYDLIRNYLRKKMDDAG